LANSVLDDEEKERVVLAHADKTIAWLDFRIQRLIKTKERLNTKKMEITKYWKALVHFCPLCGADINILEHASQLRSSRVFICPNCNRKFSVVVHKQ